MTTIDHLLRTEEASRALLPIIQFMNDGENDADTNEFNEARKKIQEAVWWLQVNARNLKNKKLLGK